MSQAQIYTTDQTDILIGHARYPDGGYRFNTSNIITKTITSLYSVGIWLTLQTSSKIMIPLFLPVNVRNADWWATQIPKYFNALGRTIPIEINDTTALNNILDIICDTLTAFVVTPTETPTDYSICLQNTFLYSPSSSSSTIINFINTASNLAKSCISRTINADYINPSAVLMFESINSRNPVVPLLGISKWAAQSNSTAEQTYLMLYVGSSTGVSPFQLLAVRLLDIEAIYINGWSQLGDLIPSIYS